MRALLARMRSIPLRWRWGALIALVLLVGLGAWYFFGRGRSGPLPPSPPPRPALGSTITLVEYREAISAALREVREARTAPGDARKEAIGRVTEGLKRVEGASVLSGEAATGEETPAVLAEADNTLVLKELGRDEPNLEAIERSLTLLSESLERGGPGAGAAAQGVLAGAQANAALADVLRDPVFDYTQNESPLRRLARWLAEISGANDPDDVLSRLVLAVLAGLAAGALIFLVLERWVPNRWARFGISACAGAVVAVLFYYATGALDVVFRVLAVAGLAVAAVALGLFVAGLNRAGAPSSVKPVSDLASVLGMSAQEARQRAREAAAEGDFRLAIRYRCLGVLLALDEAGMLVFDRTATNREYLFRAPGPLHDDLQALLERFEEVWYGNEEVEASDWEHYQRRAESVEAQIVPRAA